MDLFVYLSLQIDRQILNFLIDIYDIDIFIYIYLYYIYLSIIQAAETKKEDKFQELNEEIVEGVIKEDVVIDLSKKASQIVRKIEIVKVMKIHKFIDRFAYGLIDGLIYS